MNPSVVYIEVYIEMKVLKADFYNSEVNSTNSEVSVDIDNEILCRLYKFELEK